VALLDGEAAYHASFRSHLAAHAPDWQPDLHTHGELGRGLRQRTVNQWELMPQEWDGKQERKMGR
jgi:hypothetical protein